MGTKDQYEAQASTDAGHELSGISTAVAPDGSVSFSLHTSNGLLSLSVTTEVLHMISTEIERAHMAVLRHNLSGRDKGREAFDDMMARAPMPASIATRIDRGTAERIILYRFADRMPFAIRLTDAQIQSVKSDLLQEIKRLSN